MSDDIIPLDDIEPTGIDEYPATESVKLHGPPGTGKTTQSAARVGRLLQDYDYELSNVAWCTYRRALARDTLQRFVSWGLLGEHQLAKAHQGATRYIATTHAVASRTAGDLPDPATVGHKIDFCNRMDIQFLSQDSWEDTPGKLLFQVFEWMRNNRLNPAKEQDVRECPRLDDLRETWHGSVPAAWNKWEDYKAQKNIIGFHEQLEAPLNDNTAPPCDVLVVDEYHDATPLMAALSEQWIEDAEIAIVAGDPNQVVNAYDGADPGFFQRLDLPKVLLDRTYRVPEEHWQAATQLLQRAHQVPPVTRQSHGRIMEYRSPDFNYSEEAGWQVPSPNRGASPAKIVEEHGDNTLFLTRMQMQADGVGAALEKAGILYQSQQDLNGWNTESGAVRLSLFNALQKIRGFEPGHFDGGSGLFGYGDPPRNPDTTQLEPPEAAELLRHVHAKYLTGTRKDIKAVCKDIEKRERTPSLSDLDGWVEPEFWTRHSSGSASVQRLNKGKLDDRDRKALTNALKRHERAVSPDDIATQVQTIHASKGQEAEDVVVYDGVSRRIRRNMVASEHSAANEWRTWYVALTRASKRLHIMRGGFQWASKIIPTDIRETIGGVAADD